MSAKVDIADDGRTITVRLPMTFEKKGGRKRVIAPDGDTAWAPAKPKIDDTLVKALARAFRWRKMLESEKYESVTELAKAEKINDSYVCRVLRLTLLAPDIVEAILNGRAGCPSGRDVLMKPFSGDWQDQRLLFDCDGGARLTGVHPS